MDFDARAHDYSRKNAYWLGRIAKIVYDPEDGARAQLAALGLSDFKFFERRETQALIAGDDAMLVLAFRGTEGKLADWMTDLDVELVDGPGGKVHRGFLLALDLVWPDIWRWIDERRGKRALWITGHSLGAALAMLATARLRFDEDHPVNGLYTFGQPRTGDRDFARNFDADFGRRTFRYVNNNDIVTRVPFRSMRYSHAGTFRYFTETGDQADDISWQDKLLDRVRGRIADLLEPNTDGIKDHAMTEYIARLERAKGA
jgi:triacylglycerol lipase